MSLATPVSDTIPLADTPPSLSKRARQFLRSTRFPVVQLVVLIALVVWASLQLEGFATLPSIRATILIACLLALASLGQTLVILIGGIDMAVPGYIAVGAVCSVVLPTHHGWPLWAVALLVIAITGIAGAASGAICHFFRVQSLVVTLVMSSVLIGGVLIATQSNIMGAPPAVLTGLTSTVGTTFGLPIPPVVSITIVALIAVSLFLARSAPGRKLYATGANPIAAQGIQIRTGAVWTGTFAAAGALTGLAGMLIAGFASGATLAIGDPYFFSGLAAVLVGGTALGTAQGDYLRTVIGALTLTVLTTLLVGLGLGDGDRRILFGIVIVAVVLVYGRDRRLRDRL